MHLNIGTREKIKLVVVPQELHEIPSVQLCVKKYTSFSNFPLSNRSNRIESELEVCNSQQVFSLKQTFQATIEILTIFTYS